MMSDNIQARDFIAQILKKWDTFQSGPSSERCADHILSVLPHWLVHLVPDLIWHDCEDGTSHDDGCQYEIIPEGKYWRLTRAASGGTFYVCHTPTLEAGKSAANAHHRARVLAMFRHDENNGEAG